jgi:hypothetical protein
MKIQCVRAYNDVLTVDAIECGDLALWRGV